MPIITPCYPAMNSTYNVSESTLYLLRVYLLTLPSSSARYSLPLQSYDARRQEEFARGAQLMAQIEQQTATWMDLFEKTNFLSRWRSITIRRLVCPVSCIADAREVSRLSRDRRQREKRVRVSQMVLRAHIHIRILFLARILFQRSLVCVLSRQRVGWVESRLRLLVMNLQNTPLVRYAYPYPKCIQSERPFECRFYVALVFASMPSGPKTV
jgi:poly(A) polymerase Pap1